MGRYVVRVAEEYYDLDDCDWRGYPKRKIRYTGEEYETSEEPDDSIGCSVMSDGYTESHTVLRGSSTTSEKKKEPVDERKSMKTAILPDKITKISKRELDPYCILENLIIGKNVVEIEEGAFSWSYRLESIEVKEDNPFFTSKDGVLYDKQMTTLIRFPHQKTAPDNTFVVPDTVTRIRADAFKYCHRVSKITLPDSVKEIGTGAFSHCPITEMVIPDSVTSIGEKLFESDYNCSKLESVRLPESLKSIPNNTFYYCSQLKSIVIPDSVETIEGGAFYHCNNLKTVHFPKSLTEIESFAFKDCHSLASAQFPNPLKSIGASAFGDCKRLCSVRFSDALESIGSRAFYGCSIEFLELPGSLKKIDDNAFGSCCSLRFAAFPESYCEIDPKAFMLSDGLKTVRMPGAISKNIFYKYSGERSTVKTLRTTQEAYEINKEIIPNDVRVEIIGESLKKQSDSK